MRRYLLLTLLLVGLTFTAWTCLTQVESGERGVVMRFGRITGTVGPGLHVGLPWGLERVKRVEVDRIRRVTIGFTSSESDDMSLAVPPGQLLTGDHNLVNIQLFVDYAVNDSDKEVVQFMLNEDQADALVARAAEAALAEWVAGRGVDEVLLRGKALLPEWLMSATQDRIASYGLGVRVHLTGIGDIAPPRQVKDAFDAVNRAQTEIQTAENVAKQEADERWSRARSYKDDLEKRAPVYAAGVKNIAQAEADAFRKRLTMLEPVRKQNPDYVTALWWDEMAKIYTGMRATGRLDLLDNRLGQGGLDIIQNPLPGKKK